MRPRLVRALIIDDMVRELEPVTERRVISEESAKTMTYMMQAVVDGVAAHPAQTPGWGVAGKSGTTDVLVDGEYRDDTSLASFAGFAPVDDPRIVVLVRIDLPQGETFGGIVAAPIFAQIVAEALPYLGVPPDRLRRGARDLAHRTREDSVALRHIGVVRRLLRATRQTETRQTETARQGKPRAWRWSKNDLPAPARGIARAARVRGDGALFGGRDRLAGGAAGLALRGAAR